MKLGHLLKLKKHAKRIVGWLQKLDKSVMINGPGVNVFFKPALLSKDLLFLMIARLIKDKGLFEYLQAARLIKQRYRDITFCLVGWIDDNPAAISAGDVGAWEDQGVGQFLGRLTDVRPAIATSSVYVLPSYQEGTSRTVLEAMAMGRPVITTDAPGCRETVKDGVNGFLIPVKSVSALVSAMEKFINNSELVEKMGRCSREIAVDKFDVKKVNTVILKTIGLGNEKTV